MLDNSSTPTKTYVLVHGAWHANWCWRKLVPLLEAQGHTVLAPNLPGHGEDTTSLHAISLQTYVDTLINLLNKQQEPVILVGHSMAGIVISQVAENVPDKIHKLVYVAGFIPDYNGSLVQEEAKTKTPSVVNEIEIDATNNQIFLKPSPRLKQIFFTHCNEQDAEWAVAQLQVQPLRPFVDTVKLSDHKFGQVDKTYIECLQDEAIRIEDQRRMQSSIACHVISLATGHAPFLSMPQELAKILQGMTAKLDIKAN